MCSIFSVLSSDYYTPEGNWYGSKLGNGTWNGLVGMIMRNEVHVVNVDMTWTAERGNVVDFVTQIYQVRYVTYCFYYFNTLPCIFYYFVLLPTNAQLFRKLSHCYMFRHYHVILREPVINNLPSYTSISNAAVGNTIYN